MFTGRRKFLSLLISIIMFTSMFHMQIQAKGLVIEYDQPDVAIVIDVIDGEAIKVMSISRQATKPSVFMLRLIGVDSMANDDTYEYMKDQLLGKPIFILYDDNNLPVTDGFKNAYVFANTDESLNETLLTYGYVSLDKSFSNATYYDDLVSAEFFAIRQEKGIHKISTTPNNIININLASSSILQDHFNISPEIASAIVSYRTRNPINDSQELGFIHNDIDRDFIINHRASVHYTTNINDATLYELTSLFATSNGLNMAHDINRDRVFNPYVKIWDIKSIPTVSSYFNIIEPFITTTINDNLYVDKSLIVANVNTASSSELVKATGMSVSNADKIVQLRKDTGYIYQSLEELTKPNFPLMNLTISGYIDNLSFKTEINTAGDEELKSLFAFLNLSDEAITKIVNRINYGKPFYSYGDVASVIGTTYYKTLAPMIYIKGIAKAEKASININGSTKENNINYLQLTGQNRTKVLERKSDYTSPKDIGFLDKEEMRLVTLYTNINEASYDELRNLNTKITSAVANEIINYRSYYPIYSLDELKKVLSDMNQLYLYQLIKDDIVFY